MKCGGGLNTFPEFFSQSEFPAVSLCHAKQHKFGKTSWCFRVNIERAGLSFLQMFLGCSKDVLRSII